MPGDVATHIEVAGFTAPYLERCAFTPIRTHTMYGAIRFLGDRREIWRQGQHLLQLPKVWRVS